MSVFVDDLAALVFRKFLLSQPINDNQTLVLGQLMYTYQGQTGGQRSPLFPNAMRVIYTFLPHIKYRPEEKYRKENETLLQDYFRIMLIVCLDNWMD